MHVFIRNHNAPKELIIINEPTLGIKSSQVIFQRDKAVPIVTWLGTGT